MKYTRVSICSTALAAPPTKIPQPCAVSGAERLLFAVTARETALFFPDADPDFSEADACEWFDGKQHPEPGDWLRQLECFRPTVLVTCWDTPRIPEEFIGSKGCSLRYICHLTGSPRHIVPRSFLARGGLLTNWGRLAGAPVAEQALLLALAGLRNMGFWRSYIRRKSRDSDWPIVDLGARSLFNRRVGLHGFGHVAQTLTQLLRPFHVTLSAYSEGVPRELMRSAGVTPCDSLAELFSTSDILFECEALTPKSEGCVDARILSALPDGAVFVNVGRGRVVDEPALLHEVRQGRIRAALDVVSEEPVSEQSEVMRVPGLVVSPHIGGPTPDRFPLCGRFALQNLRNYFNGEPLEALVTLEIFDRST
ncbi:MAG: hydroxyacid dehydrogenase [Terrimicrobiaceae bacterium]